ncbi:MAG: hypothetical protein HY363_05900 [Candidatus Aenigmarchaeota archaeon]|nr:hypothetical protein [Candidatus Aenigmarchaeota archaeon]
MILIISTCKEKLSELEFVLPIARIIGKCVLRHHTEVTDRDIASAKKIILTGTALKDFEYLKHDFRWLKNVKIPVLGICAGMQIIAKEFGIKLENKVNIGVKPVQVMEENKLASGTFNAYFLHTKTGTGNFKTLAVSENTSCMIKHPTKEIYGCIFHPEVMNEELLRNFAIR